MLACASGHKQAKIGQASFLPTILLCALPTKLVLFQPTSRIKSTYHKSRNLLRSLLDFYLLEHCKFCTPCRRRSTNCSCAPISEICYLTMLKLTWRLTTLCGQRRPYLRYKNTRFTRPKTDVPLAFVPSPNFRSNHRFDLIGSSWRPFWHTFAYFGFLRSSTIRRKVHNR